MNSIHSKRILGKLTLLVISFAVFLVLGEQLLCQTYPVDTGTSFQYRIPIQFSDGF
jgi:hypothetical protein